MWHLLKYPTINKKCICVYLSLHKYQGSFSWEKKKDKKIKMSSPENFTQHAKRLCILLFLFLKF